MVANNYCIPARKVNTRSSGVNEAGAFTFESQGCCDAVARPREATAVPTNMEPLATLRMLSISLLPASH